MSDNLRHFPAKPTKVRPPEKNKIDKTVKKIVDKIKRYFVEELVELNKEIFEEGSEDLAEVLEQLKDELSDVKDHIEYLVTISKPDSVDLNYVEDKPSGYTKVYECTCGKKLGYGERKWKYCPMCGKELIHPESYKITIDVKKAYYKKE